MPGNGARHLVLVDQRGEAQLREERLHPAVRAVDVQRHHAAHAGWNGGGGVREECPADAATPVRAPDDER